MARRRLKSKPELQVLYEADEAVDSGLSVFWSGLLEGKFKAPDGMDDFLRLARTIIADRIKARSREQKADKRNPTPYPERDGRTPAGGIYIADDINLFESGAPGPDVKAATEEEIQRLLGLLDSREREVVNERLEGSTNERIAGHQGVSVRTIERMLEQIRERWTRALEARERP